MPVRGHSNRQMWSDNLADAIEIIDQTPTDSDAVRFRVSTDGNTYGTQPAEVFVLKLTMA